MNRLENFLKYKYILLAIMILTIFSVFDIFNIKDGLQTNLYQGFKLVKITEEKIKIDEKNLVISARMPEIHYSNEEVERYINSYIRRNINDSINHERQESQLYKNNSKTNVNINVTTKAIPSEIKKFTIFWGLIVTKPIIPVGPGDTFNTFVNTEYAEPKALPIIAE